MITEDILKEVVGQVLAERAVHHKLEMTSKDVRNYRVWLKNGTLSTKLMLEVLNRAGMLQMKKVANGTNDETDASSNEGQD